MRNQLLLASLGLAMTSHVASAGSSSGVITGVISYHCAPAVECVFVQASAHANHAACNVSSRFVISGSDPKFKTTVALLLGAYFSGTPVILYGTGACTTSSNSEDLSHACTGTIPC